MEFIASVELAGQATDDAADVFVGDIGWEYRV